MRKQNATVQEPHNSHFKLTQQALMQSAGRILNPLEITQVGAAGVLGCLICRRPAAGSMRYAAWLRPAGRADMLGRFSVAYGTCCRRKGFTAVFRCTTVLHSSLL